MESIKYVAMAGLLGAIAFLTGCSPSVTWKEYVYKDHGFAVAFTQPPTTSIQSSGFLAEEGSDAIDFGVVATCNPAADKSSDQMLSDAVEATRRSGTVRNVTYTATGSVVGREMLVDRSNATTVRQRAFVKDNCLYQIFASSQNGPDDELVTHFLDSFRLLGG